jgi:MFS family permease
MNQSTTGRKSGIFSVFVIGLLIADFFWLLGTKISDMLLDLLVADFPGDPAEIYAQIQSIDGIGNYIVAGAVLFWGILVDRYPKSRKIWLWLANAGWIVVNICLFLLPTSFTLYIIIQVFYAIALGANGPLIYSYLGDLFPVTHRGRLFSVFTTFIYIIKGSIVAVNGIIGQLLNSWKAPLFIMAIGGLIIMILFIFIKEPLLGEIEPEFTEKIQSGKKYSYYLQWKDIIAIMKQPTNLLFLCQSIFGMMGVVIVTRYLSYWLTSTSLDGLGMNATIAVLLLGISGGIGALLGINIAGWWADRQFQRGWLDRMLYFSIVCVFAQVLGYALLVFVPVYPENIDFALTNPLELFTDYPVFWQFLLIFNFCLFCGTGIGSIVNMTRTHINLPEHRGTAAALYDSFDFIGAGIALFLGSSLITLTGSFRLTIFFGSLAWLLSGCIWLLITRKIQADYENVRYQMRERANQN